MGKPANQEIELATLLGDVYPHDSGLLGGEMITERICREIAASLWAIYHERPDVRIPTQSGHHSEAKPATVPT